MQVRTRILLFVFLSCASFCIADVCTPSSQFVAKVVFRRSVSNCARSCVAGTQVVFSAASRAFIAFICC